MSRPRPRPAPSADAIEVRVIPRAGRSAIAGVRDGAILVRLAAAPVDGAANAELIDLLSRSLSIPKRDIAIVSGARSRSKRVHVAGMNRTQVVDTLVGSAS